LKCEFNIKAKFLIQKELHKISKNRTKKKNFNRAAALNTSEGSQDKDGTWKKRCRPSFTESDTKTLKATLRSKELCSCRDRNETQIQRIQREIHREGLGKEAPLSSHDQITARVSGLSPLSLSLSRFIFFYDFTDTAFYGPMSVF